MTAGFVDLWLDGAGGSVVVVMRDSNDVDAVSGLVATETHSDLSRR